MTKERYQSLPVKTLRELAKARGIKGMSTQKKAVIIDAMLELDAREAEAAAAAEARDVSQNISGGTGDQSARESDTASVSADSVSGPISPQRDTLGTEETEQAAL